jgi:murein DD-endopeptidase MepM/ murein hydrolase activator NlpD
MRPELLDALNAHRADKAAWCRPVLVLGLAMALCSCPKREAPIAKKDPPPTRIEQTEPVGVFHELKRGETLWQLAAYYGVDIDELIDVNGISDPRDLEVGRLIFVPDVDPMAPPRSTPAEVKPVPPATRSEKGNLHSTLRWPLDEGVMYSGFGIRHGVRHDGIDIGAPEGTPVLAAADADVIYVGYDKSFGNLVILRHAGNIVTVYAHNRDVVAKIGDKVRSGQTVAHVGQSGRSEGPHLHFETREGKTPVDPLSLLPSD